MSRAVKEDLSDLPFGERMSKRWSNFQDWVHDSEKESYFGERNANQWGQLCGYYLVFYLALAGFTAIFFGILGFMLPIRPTEVVLGVCNRDASAGDGCGPGPFFQAIDLYSTGERGDDRFTDEVLRFSLCEPGFVAIPRALNLGGGETVGYNKDDLKRGYTQFIYENDRVNCAGLFNDPTYNPSCTNSANAAQTAPLIPLKSDGSGIARYATPAQVRRTSNFFNNGETYTKPAAIYNFTDGTNTYSTFIVFFRFNKVWNFQPYTEFKTDLTTPLAVQNKIGVTCRISKGGCENADIKAVDFNNQTKSCDPDSRTISADGRVSIDMLTDVMVNHDQFPWRGGALNMGFGSLAVTLKTPDETFDEFEILCTMGDAISNGKAGPDAGGNPIQESAKVIQNFDKYAGARAYTNSEGKEITIPVFF